MSDCNLPAMAIRQIRPAALALLVAATPAGNAQTPQDFAAQATVSVPAGTPIARVALPAATFAALRTADGGDLRIFNASGQLLPHALINAAAQPVTRPDAAGQRIFALPIHSETASAGGNAPTLRIIEGPQRRVIEYSAAAAGNTTKAMPATPEIRGWLFDTRSTDSDLRAVELEGALPTATIVKITLSASSDLKSWRVLASDAPVFEFPAIDANVGPGPLNRRVNLPAGTRLKDQYLRLTWSGAGSAPLPVVALRTVAIGDVAAVPPVAVDLGAPASSGDEAAQWTLPSAYRAQALRLSTSADNALMPVRVSTRARAGEPWRVVASSVVYRLVGADGVANANPAQRLAWQLEREVRVEPQPGYRLSGVPLTLTLEYPPLHALFVATGPGPFTVASGKAGLTSAALPVATVMPGYRAGDEYALPVLSTQAPAVAAATGPAGLVATGGKGAVATDWLNRTTVLWGVLVLAVLVLGGLALSLLRAPAKR